MAFKMKGFTPFTKMAAVGTAERKRQYDIKGWKYDDTIAGYNRDGSRKGSLSKFKPDMPDVVVKPRASIVADPAKASYWDKGKQRPQTKEEFEKAKKTPRSKKRDYTKKEESQSFKALTAKMSDAEKRRLYPHMDWSKKDSKKTTTTTTTKPTVTATRSTKSKTHTFKDGTVKTWIPRFGDFGEWVKKETKSS